MWSLCLNSPSLHQEHGRASFVPMSFGNEAAFTSVGSILNPAQQESMASDVCTAIPSGQDDQVNHCGNHPASNGNRMEIILGLKHPIY